MIGRHAFAVVAFALGAVGCMTTDSDEPRSLTIKNDESVTISAIFINPAGDEILTDNLLGAIDLAPGNTFTLDLSCGNYEIQLDDQAGGECELMNYTLCFWQEDWLVTDSICRFSA